MNRFTPEELYEIFLKVDDDGEMDCPVFVADMSDNPSMAKCLELESEDKKAMQQALRLARKELAHEIAEIRDIENTLIEDLSYLNHLEDKHHELSSRVCRIMRNYI